MVLNVAIRIIDMRIENPPPGELIEKLELPVPRLHGLEPAWLLFTDRTYRWLSPVPFDPAQHK